LLGIAAGELSFMGIAQITDRYRHDDYSLFNSKLLIFYVGKIQFFSTSIFQNASCGLA
jgi:hypothetical protein